MDHEQARQFLSERRHAVLVTHRSDGGLQTSPVLAVLDDQGRVVISSRETAYKVRNLRHDSRATVCAFTDDFYGDWVQVEGRAEVVSLPEAMDPLVDYYRRAAGEHDDWDDYRAAMERERRVAVRIEIERAGPDRRG